MGIIEFLRERKAFALLGQAVGQLAKEIVENLGNEADDLAALRAELARRAIRGDLDSHIMRIRAVRDRMRAAQRERVASR